MPPALDGDEPALYRTHHARLVTLLRRRLRLDQQCATEMAAIAWLRFLEAQPARQNVLGWLYTTAKHETLAH